MNLSAIIAEAIENYSEQQQFSTDYIYEINIHSPDTTFNWLDIHSDTTLTSLQISSATQSCLYSDLTPEVKLNCPSCPISHDDFQDDDEIMIIAHCGHCFSKEGIINWFNNNNNTCPMCRHVIAGVNTVD